MEAAILLSSNLIYNGWGLQKRSCLFVHEVQRMLEIYLLHNPEKEEFWKYATPLDLVSLTLSCLAVIY